MHSKRRLEKQSFHGRSYCTQGFTPKRPERGAALMSKCIARDDSRNKVSTDVPTAPTDSLRENQNEEPPDVPRGAYL